MSQQLNKEAEEQMDAAITTAHVGQDAEIDVAVVAEKKEKNNNNDKRNWPNKKCIANWESLSPLLLWLL